MVATEQFTVDKNLREVPLRSPVTAFLRFVLNMKWVDHVSEVANGSPTNIPQCKAEVISITNENSFFIIFV